MPAAAGRFADHDTAAGTLRTLLRRTRRTVASHPVLWLLPTVAYTALQLRLALAGGSGHGLAHGARLVHKVPGLKAVLPYVLSHLQALPSVGGLALILLVEGAILWRARVEVDELSEPFAGPFADPRSLAFFWVLALLAFALGTTAGWLLGPGAAGPRLLLLTLPAIALAQTLFTAQALTVWDSAEPLSLSHATWRAAPALPGLLAWEIALALLFTAVLLVQARILAHPLAHPHAVVRVARVAVLVALGARALLAWVPVILVLDRCSLPVALRRATAMWRLAPGWTMLPVAVLALVFTAYAYAGSWVGTAGGGGAASGTVARAGLGYGALAMHVVAAAFFAAVYRQSPVGFPASPQPAQQVLSRR